MNTAEQVSLLLSKLGFYGVQCIVFAFIAVGGIFLGKTLRDKKDAKTQQ